MKRRPRKSAPGVCAVTYSCNSRTMDMVLSKDEECVKGRAYLTQKSAGFKTLRPRAYGCTFLVRFKSIGMGN